MPMYRSIVQCFNRTVDLYMPAENVDHVKQLLEDWLGINYEVCHIRIWNWSNKKLVYKQEGGEQF